MKVILLAAGLGTRLRPITDVLAKPAVPLLNVPLLFWSLDFLRELKIKSVVANLHHLPDTLTALAPQINDSGLDIEFSLEAEKPLGSGGGLWKAQDKFRDEESFALANADEIILPLRAGALQRLRRQHEDSGAIATLLTMRRSDVGTKFGGVWVNENKNILGFGKDRTKFPRANEGLHYVGVTLLNRRIFKYLPEGESNILYDAVTRAIAAGEKATVQVEELVWFETGSAADYLSATGELLDLISPQRPENDVLATAAVAARSTLQKHLHPGTYLWESHSGARLFASEFAVGSIRRQDVCEALEKFQQQTDPASSGKAFAVIGADALIESPEIFSSVVLSGAHVQKNVRLQDLILPPPR